MSLRELESFLDDEPKEVKFLLPLYLPIELVPIKSIDPFENTFVDVYLEFDELSLRVTMSERISYMPWRSLDLVLKSAGLP